MRYYGTFSCGHDGSINIFGPGKERQWRVERRFSGLCPDCYKKMLEQEREQKDRDSEKESEEMDLPKLTGSEKQIKWATTIRLGFVKKAYEMFKPNSDSKEMIEMLDALEYGIMCHTDARYWIDHRDESARQISMAFLNEYKEQKALEVYEDVLEEMQSERAIAKPESVSKNGVVEIVSEGSTIKVLYPKDEIFRNIVKKYGFIWSGKYWYREITEFNGPMLDRISEIGNALLQKGFVAMFPDEKSKVQAVEARFKKEQTRWIKFQNNHLSICWKGINSTLYEAAKKIHGSHWKDGSMKVPIEFHQEVCDFAETFGFAFSQRSIAEIKKEQMKEEKIKSFNILCPRNSAILSDEEYLRKKLISTGTIVDLIDDEVE